MKGNRVIQIVVAGILIFAAGLWTYFASGRVKVSHEYVISKYYRFESLGEEAIVQHFTPDYDRLDSIELLLIMIYPETDGLIHIEILDESGKQIFTKGYKASQIPAGEFYSYKIGKKIEAGHQYEIRISYDGEAEENPQIMISQKNKNLLETGTMYVHGEGSEYNLAVSYYYR